MYRFPLESLLTHRRYQEDVLQKELAASRRRVNEEQNQLRQIKEKKRQCFQKIQQRQREDGTVSDLVLYWRYLERLAQELDRQHQRVVAAEKQFKHAHHELIEAVRKRKMLEKLKAKGHHTFQQRMLKNERKFMDEVAATHFNNHA